MPTVNWILRVLAVIGVLAVLGAALLPAPSGFGLQNLLIPTFIGVAWDLALAAAIVALVAAAQRRHWGWFVGMVLVALLGAIAPIVWVVTIDYGILPLSLYNCGGGVQCNSLPDVAGIVRALVPIAVLLYSFHPTHQHRSEPV
jgi:hypothetical protein